MWKTLQNINKNLIVAIPVLMVAGFLAGMFMNAAPLKQLIVPFTFLMVYPMMVTLKIKKVIEGGDTKAQILAQVINWCSRHCVYRHGPQSKSHSRITPAAALCACAFGDHLCA